MYITNILSFICLLSLLAYIRGYCQKNCNGHGTCEANDKCNCYNGPDGTAAWTGADCSLRTCPR